MPRAAGLVITGDPGSDRIQEADTLQCGHCGAHWTIMPGSGNKRGFCMNCGKPVCGKKACMAGCVPYERQIENMEAGLPADTPAPTSISIPKLWLPGSDS